MPPQQVATENKAKIEFTPFALYNYFVSQVKQNLHVVLAMSPIGDAFRTRLRLEYIRFSLGETHNKYWN